MPYNTSKLVVQRNRRYLDDLMNAEKTLSFPSRNSKKLAYQIREAIFAAEKYPEFERYHNLRADYRIRARSGWVECEFIGVPSRGTEPSSPEHLEVPEVTEVHGVVGACIKFAAKSDEIYFPNAVMDADQKFALYQWGQSENPPWRIISQDDAGVTMTRKRDVEEMFLWSPDEEET